MNAPPMQATLLHTKRLLLRPAGLDDLAPFHAMRADPDVMRFSGRAPHSSIEETREWLLKRIDLSPDRGEDFVIEHEGAVIGKAGFQQFPELGYMLARDAWGKGFAREALEAVIARAFDLHALDHILAIVDPANAASLHLLRSFGFTQHQSTVAVGHEDNSLHLVLQRP